MKDKKPKKPTEATSWTTKDPKAWRQGVSFANKKHMMVRGYFAGYYGHAVFVDYGGTSNQVVDVKQLIFHGNSWSDFGAIDPKVDAKCLKRFDKK